MGKGGITGEITIDINTKSAWGQFQTFYARYAHKPKCSNIYQEYLERKHILRIIVHATIKHSMRANCKCIAGTCTKISGNEQKGTSHN